MRTRFAALAVAAAMVAMAESTPALADAKHDEAVRLFEKGRELREKNDLNAAAEMFALSIASEPSIGAYYNLGLINDLQNHPRAAVEAFRKSRDLAREKKDPRDKDASDALTKLLESRNYVTLDTTDVVANTPGLRVTIDGDPVPAGQLKGEVFLRGERDHSIVVTATGHKELHLQAPNKNSVKVVLGEAISLGATPPPPPPPEPTSGSGWGWQKWTGIGLMGAGLIGVAYGTIWGLGYASSSGDLSDKQQNAASGCSGAKNTITACNGDMTSPRVQAANTAIMNYNTNEAEAKAEAPVAIGLGIAGLALIGGGIYLFATAPSGAKEESTNAARLRIVPSVSARQSGLTVLGTF